MLYEVITEHEVPHLVAGGAEFERAGFLHNAIEGPERQHAGKKHQETAQRNAQQKPDPWPAPQSPADLVSRSITL